MYEEYIMENVIVPSMSKKPHAPGRGVLLVFVLIVVTLSTALSVLFLVWGPPHLGEIVGLVATLIQAFPSLLLPVVLTLLNIVGWSISFLDRGKKDKMLAICELAMTPDVLQSVIFDLARSGPAQEAEAIIFLPSGQYRMMKTAIRKHAPRQQQRVVFYTFAQESATHE